MKRLAWMGVGVVAVLASAEGVRAEAKDATPGTGIRIGTKSRLHLAVGAGLGMDSNPNYAPIDLVLQRQTGERMRFFNREIPVDIPAGWKIPRLDKLIFDYPPDAVLSVRPSAAFEMPGEKVNASAFGALNYFEYLGVLQPGLPFVPGMAAYSQAGGPLLGVKDYNTGYRRLRTIDGQAGGQLELNRKGPFGFAVSGNASRAVDPAPIMIGSRLARTNFGGVMAGILRPGGGTMSFSGNMNAGLEIYDPQNGIGLFGERLPAFNEWSSFPLNLFGQGNPVDVLGLAPAANASIDPRKFHSANFGFGGGWQWRFLPKSSVFANANVGSHVYLWPFSNSNSPSFPVGADFGYMGQVTAKLGIVASLGFAYPIVVCMDPQPLVKGNTGFTSQSTSQACATNTGFFTGQPQANGRRDTTKDPQSDLDFLFGLAGAPVVPSQYLWWAPELTRWQSLAAAPGGQLEARYQIKENLSAAVGVRRQMRLVPLYRYMTDNRFYANIGGTVMQRVSFNLAVSEAVQSMGQLTDEGAAYNGYPFDYEVRRAIPFLKDSDPGRWDNDLTAGGSVGVSLTRWFIVGASNSFTWHSTNAWTGPPNEPAPRAEQGRAFNLSYVRNLLMGTVELRY